MGGGYKKIFVIEEGIDNLGVVSCLHAPEYDEFDYTFSDKDDLLRNEQLIQHPSQIFKAFDDKGGLKHIISGKKHMIFLTEEGKLYSYGYGEYGCLGLGGIAQCVYPSLLKTISDKKVIQIACGEYHTLALTSEFDVFAWGRGFEGQLGIRNDIEAVSSPKFLSFFYKPPEDELALKKCNKLKRKMFKNYIIFIAAGANHSLAINYQKKLYGWGEARLGQIGTGKKIKETMPVIINLEQSGNKLNEENKNMGNYYILIFEEESSDVQLKIKIDQNFKIVENSKMVKIKTVSAGYGHTIAISGKLIKLLKETGNIYAWGFNVKGQLGTGNTKSLYYPKQLLVDILGKDLPEFEKVSCGYYTTFAIDINGTLYSWGGGNLGQKDDFLQDYPRKIGVNTEGRIFTNMFCTLNCLRIISMRPESGPSSGGTMLSLIGTGFADTGRQSIKFTFTSKAPSSLKPSHKYSTSQNIKKKSLETGDTNKTYSLEVPCHFDSNTDCFHCFTPKFEEVIEEVTEWPLECKVEMTLDGTVYIPSEQKFLIYSSKILISSIFPKCASVRGGTELTLNVPSMDELTATKLTHLTVGFQAKAYRKDKNYGVAIEHSDNMSNSSKKESVIAPSSNLLIAKQDIKDKHKGAVNPLDLSVSDNEIDKENWICVGGIYEKGKILCTVPKLEEFNSDSLQFNVDIAINGQQFTGTPSSFRFYDIIIKNILPTNGMSIGGASITMYGDGFFDTAHKKIKFKTKFGERLIDIQWDKKERTYTFIQPPLSWLFGGEEPSENDILELKKEPVEVFITLSGVEWMQIGNFSYFDPEIEKFGPVIFENNLNEEAKKNVWFSKQEEVNPFKDCKNETEINKKKDEIKKQQDLEDNEMATYFKKAGNYLYIYGNNFVDCSNVKAKFIFENKFTIVDAVYKNSTKIGVIIPEMEEIMPGIVEIGLEISLNGQQFSNSGKTFRYLSFDPNLTPDQRQKYEDEQTKVLKKPGGKK